MKRSWCFLFCKMVIPGRLRREGWALDMLSMQPKNQQKNFGESHPASFCATKLPAYVPFRQLFIVTG
ncbi:hypothetical protein VNO78_07384 [Psophocarpus tetragonolobus]|uniref:Uncharacterized protein n=1 Tax=Psophocarpus tetragonolobus TaxID=3891 RepID=A0AAN9XRV6_PSOTE